MSKKLEKNGMWESSRMMLPEHREAILANNRSLKILIKPELDEQERTAIDQALHNALISNGTIALTVYSKYELKTVTATVLKLDVILRTVKITLEDPFAEQDECEWVAIRDILKAELKEIEVWDAGDMDC